MSCYLSETASLIFAITGEEWLSRATGLSHAEIDLVIAGGKQLGQQQQMLLEQLGEVVEVLLEVEQHTEVGRMLQEGWPELENRSPLMMCLAGNLEALMLAAEVYAARVRTASPPPPSARVIRFPVERRHKPDSHRPAG